MRDESKLPKWAQDELRIARSEAEHWRSMLHTHGAPVTGPARDAPFVAVTDYDRGDYVFRALPIRQWVRFSMSRRAYVDVALREYGIDVTADSSLSVMPRASNAIVIDPRRTS